VLQGDVTVSEIMRAVMDDDEDELEALNEAGASQSLPILIAGLVHIHGCFASHDSAEPPSMSKLGLQPFLSTFPFARDGLVRKTVSV
jgi:hypothetical protein